MAIHLGRSLPNASRDRPGRWRGNSPGPRRADRPYLVLLRVGFTLPRPLPAARCALSAPFHPYRAAPRGDLAWRFAFCGTFPGVAPAGRYPAPYSRGARTFLPAITPRGAARRPSDRLAPLELGAIGRRVNKSAASQSGVFSTKASRLASLLAVSKSALPSTRRGRKWR